MCEMRSEAGAQGESEVCFAVLPSPICTDGLLFSVRMSVSDRPKSSLSVHASQGHFCVVSFLSFLGTCTPFRTQRYFSGISTEFSLCSAFSLHTDELP